MVVLSSHPICDYCPAKSPCFDTAEGPQCYMSVSASTFVPMAPFTKALLITAIILALFFITTIGAIVFIKKKRPNTRIARALDALMMKSSDIECGKSKSDEKQHMKSNAIIGSSEEAVIDADEAQTSNSLIGDGGLKQHLLAAIDWSQFDSNNTSNGAVAKLLATQPTASIAQLITTDAVHETSASTPSAEIAEM